MNKRFGGIKGKILASTIITILVTLISISSIVIYQVNKKAYEDYYSNSKEQMSSITQAINIFYDQLDKNLDMLAENPLLKMTNSSISTYKNTTEATSMDPVAKGGLEKAIYEVFEQYANSHKGTVYVYMGTTEGSYIQWPKETITVGYNPVKRPWYEDAISKSGSIIRTAPYTFKNHLFTSNARTFTDNNGKVLGVMALDVEQSAISDMLSKMKIGETGYAIIVHNTGIVMADGKNPKNNFKKIDELGIQGLNKILDKELKSFEVTINGEKYIVTPYKVEGTDWILASFMTEKELQSGAKGIINIVIVSSIILLLVAAGLLTYISGSITKPIIAVTKKIKDFSNLEFLEDHNLNDKNYLNRKDETGDMIRALSSMRVNVAEFIRKTADATEQVAASSEELTATSQEAATSSEEVAKTIEEIAKGASEQAVDTETAANSVEELGSLLEQDLTYIKELNVAASQIEKKKEEGFLIIKDLINKTEKNNDASSNIYNIIMSNNESAEKIESASTMIQNIADQTNLLALNAAIEAARAGEAGKGFAVVADEIRKLAEQSNSFTNDIKNVINELKTKSQSAVKIMEETKHIVEEQAGSVGETQEKFEGIAEAIDFIKNIINKLNNSAELMSDNKNKIIELTQNLSSISEENAAGTEQVSASMEEQAATVQEIANSGESLAMIAEDLRVLIAKFKI